MKTLSNNLPKVSIGLAVFNGEKYIREALDSLLAQTFTDFEVLISDNASTDSTETICKDYAIKDKRIRYIRQSNNIGPSKNFKFLVEESYGEYFSWLAHDDLLNADFIHDCSKFLDNNPDCVLVSGDFLAINENGEAIAEEKLSNIRSDIPWDNRVFEFYRYPISNVFLCVYGLMRKNTLLSTYDTLRTGPLLAGSELPTLARIASEGQIASLPKVLRKYRFHGESAYHVELRVQSLRPIKGRLVKFYNLWWNRVDQMYVLVSSPSYSRNLKIRVCAKIVYFNIQTFSERLVNKLSKYVKSLKRLD